MNLKKIGKLFTDKFVGTGPSTYKRKIYRAAVSQRLRNTDLGDANSADEGVKKEGILKCTKVVRRQVSTV